MPPPAPYIYPGASSWRLPISPPQTMALVAFMFSVAVTSGFMVIPFFVFNQLQGGVVMSGVFSGAQAICYVSTSLMSARFLARAGNGLVWAFLGVAGFALCMCMMPLFENPWHCGLMFSGAYAFSAFAWPAFHSWVGAEHALDLRARNMGLLNVAWSAGAGAGPLLAGPLYEMDYRLPFAFIAVVCFLALILIRLMPEERAWYGAMTGTVLPARVAHDSASEAFLVCAWTATFAANICVGAGRAVFPKRLDGLISSGLLRLFFEAEAAPGLNAMPATRFSWLMMAFGLSMSTLFFVFGRCTWWHHRFSVLAGVQLLTACAMWMLGYTHSLIVMAVCFAIMGVNLGVAFFSSVYYGMANPLQKHGRAAINEGAVGLGVLVGSFGFAYIAEYVGVSESFYFMPVIMVTIIVCQALLLHRHRRTG